ncbi:MAG: hypothetical protein WCJ59_00515 [bacterium]
MKRIFKHKIVKRSFLIGVLIFAFVGFSFVAVYFAIKFKITNSNGIIDSQNEAFWESGKNKAYTKDSLLTVENYCRLSVLNTYYPTQVSKLEQKIITDATSTQKVIELLDFAAKNNPAYQNGINKCSINKNSRKITIADFISTFYQSNSPLVWMNAPEWQVFKEAVSKDKGTLVRVEKETGIKSRTLVAILAAEQMRLYYSQRGIYEEFFAPLKILGSQSQFSWGIMGLKPDTAIAIENNLASTTSPFYLGKANENTLAFTDQDTDQQRFERITNEHDHYYAFLYSAIYLKQIIAQWQKSGVEISNRPEILATLYNIGFVNSKPNNNPQVGGAELDIGDQKYSFGRLAYEFYYSGELTDFLSY